MLLNDLEGYFCFNFNYLFENDWLLKFTASHIHCKCGLEAIPMTLSHFCDFSYSYAALDEISTDVVRRAVPLR